MGASQRLAPRRAVSDADRRQARQDLSSHAEIAAMVRCFYRDVAQDDLLGPMFNEVARIDWPEHLAKLTAFWCRALLSEPGYEGNPYRSHQLIHAQAPFTLAHFERWLTLFEEDLDAGWAGPRVEQARTLARRVADVHSRQLVRAPQDHTPATVSSSLPTSIDGRDQNTARET